MKSIENPFHSRTILLGFNYGSMYERTFISPRIKFESNTKKNWPRFFFIGVGIAQKQITLFSKNKSEKEEEEVENNNRPIHV